MIKLTKYLIKIRTGRYYSEFKNKDLGGKRYEEISSPVTHQYTVH